MWKAAAWLRNLPECSLPDVRGCRFSQNSARFLEATFLCFRGGHSRVFSTCPDINPLTPPPVVPAQKAHFKCLTGTHLPWTSEGKHRTPVVGPCHSGNDPVVFGFFFFLFCCRGITGRRLRRRKEAGPLLPATPRSAETVRRPTETLGGVAREQESPKALAASSPHLLVQPPLCGLTS